MNEIDNVVAIIAQKHGVRIQKDDPVLMVDTILKQFGNSMEEMHQEHRQAFLSLLEAEQEKWSQESKKRADRVLTAALEASKKATRELIEINVKEIEASITSAMTPKIVFLEQQYAKVYYLAVANMLGAGLLACAALFFFFRA